MEATMKLLSVFRMFLWKKLLLAVLVVVAVGKGLKVKDSGINQHPTDDRLII